jgi:hypothetical protein
VVVGVGQNVRVWDLGEAIIGLWDPNDKHAKKSNHDNGSGSAGGVGDRAAKALPLVGKGGKNCSKKNVYRDIQVPTLERKKERKGWRACLKTTAGPCGRGICVCVLSRSESDYYGTMRCTSYQQNTRDALAVCGDFALGGSSHLSVIR